jgi:cellulose synthase/poly-beta-1,6-N-acetylglucosamine synthase-like glycosyltransferase
MQVFAPIAAFVTTLAIGYLVIVAAAAVAGAFARGGRRERAVDAYEALAVSRFTIPVSVVVPLTGDSGRVSHAVESLLGLNYPELEVIVVADTTAAAALDALREQWSLEPKEIFYRRTLETAAVHRIFSSERDARLVVVEKARGGRADALNCGTNIARFRYIVSVDPEVSFDRDALLRLMAPAMRDPGAVLAVTSYVERQGATVVRRGKDDWTRAGDDYQRLASIRSWMASRLAWHQLRCGLPPRDGVTAWRRDAVLEFGGFSLKATDAELDLLVRLQIAQTERTPGRVVRTSEVFGRTTTVPLTQAAAHVHRRQRAVVEALRMFRAMPGRAADRRTMRRMMLVELLTPAAQVAAFVIIVLAAGAGWVSWPTPWLTVLLLTFGYGVVSASALLLRGGTPGAPSGAELKRLLLRAPLELLVYRPALLVARLR